MLIKFGKYRKIYTCMILLLEILFIITCIHPSFSLDESFTYGLISHSTNNLIKLDIMDVHPPLYYLLLKLFISVTTFWTESVFIKVIFARLFSLFSAILFIIVGLKILQMYNINFNSRDILINFLLMPPIVVSSLKIRMYSIGALFVILTFYNVLKFQKNNKIEYLMYATLFAIFSSYTFYFAGLSAGLFLVIAMIQYLLKNEFKLTLETFIGCILLTVSFVPWIPSALKQVIYHSKFDSSDNNNTISQVIYSLSQLNPNGVISLILGAVIIVLFIIIMMYSAICKFQILNYLLVIVLANTVLSLIISILLCKQKFQAGAIYPISTILFYILSIIITKSLDSYNIYSKFSILCIVLLTLLSCAHIYKNVNVYDIPSIELSSNYNRWKNSKGRNVILKTNEFPISKPMTISEDSIYLSSIHKNICVQNYDYSKLSRGLLNDNKNGKLIKHTFNNIKIYD